MARWGSQVGVLLVNRGLPERNGPSFMKSFVSDCVSNCWLVSGSSLGFMGMRGSLKSQGTKIVSSVLDEAWTYDGWPYDLDHKRLVQGLNGLLSEHDVVVRCGMCFGTPSIQQGLSKLVQLGCDSLVIVPLNAFASLAYLRLVDEQVKGAMAKSGISCPVSFVEGYALDPLHLRALAANVLHAGFDPNGSDRLMLVFESQVKDILPGSEQKFRHTVGRAEGALRQLLGVSEERVASAFARPLGKDLDWMEPFASDVVRDLAVGEWARSAEGRLFLAWPDVPVDGRLHAYDLGQNLIELFATTARDAWMPRDEGDVVSVPPLGKTRANLKVLQSVILDHLNES